MNVAFSIVIYNAPWSPGMTETGQRSKMIPCGNRHIWWQDFCTIFIIWERGSVSLVDFTARDLFLHKFFRMHVVFRRREQNCRKFILPNVVHAQLCFSLVFGCGSDIYSMVCRSTYLGSFNIITIFSEKLLFFSQFDKFSLY